MKIRIIICFPFILITVVDDGALHEMRHVYDKKGNIISKLLKIVNSKANIWFILSKFMNNNNKQYSRNDTQKV